MRSTGYDLNIILAKGPRTTVFRGKRRADGAPVVVKRLNDPTPDEAARLEREHAVTRLAAGPGIVAVVEVARVDGSPALVMHDSGGDSLAAIMAGAGTGLADALAITRDMARALDRLHQAGMVHCDINPANIVWNRRTRGAELIDFGSTAKIGAVPAADPERIEGVPAYMAPEQTGRTSHGIDWRSDLYSLGMTLYEMLTGSPAFDDDDVLSVLHGHIARLPQAPADRNPAVPRQVSDIVMKLLAKDPAERYQSARGLAADLDECLWALEAGALMPAFTPGRNDRSDQMRLPERLYAREGQLGRLGQAFAAAEAGGARLVLVRGPAGIGKTALVHQARKAAPSFAFAEGKYEQLKGSVPYSALTQALGRLARHILGEGDAELATVQARLTNALAGNGGVVTGLMPEWEMVLGAAPPPMAPLPPSESELRFQLALQNLIGAVARPERPLALFLDDLQWADRSSLALLARLAADPELKHVVVIGAFRDDALPADHPLTQMIKATGEEGVIGLDPLADDAVEMLVADALHADRPQIAALAALCHGKSGGNPFFLGQFLLSLSEGGLLRFDHGCGGWLWDAAAIAGTGSTDNVVDLMVAKIRRLPPDCTRALSFGACLGSAFEMSDLAAALAVAPEDALSALRPSVVEDLIQPERDGDGRPTRFRFTHDRVQQAAYSMIAEGERGPLHQRLGRLLLERLDPRQSSDRLFELVDHCNRGPRDPQAPDAQALAGRNMEAAQRAKLSAAFESALGYALAGLEWMGGARAWARDYARTLALHEMAVEAAFMTGDGALMEDLCRAVLAHARTPDDTIRTQYSRISAAVTRGDPSTAIAIGLSALSALGISVPPRPGKLRLMMELRRGRRAIAAHESMLARDGGRAEECEAAPLVSLLVGVGGAAYTARPDLLVPLVVRALERVDPAGNLGQSALVFGLWAIICGVVGDRKSARTAGAKAAALLDQARPSPQLGRPLFLSLFAGRHWGEPLAGLRDGFRRAFDLTLAGGDGEYACYALVNWLLCGWFPGMPLDRLRDDAAETARKLDRISGLYYRDFVGALRQAVDTLVDGNADRVSLSGPHLADETAAMDELQARRHAFPLGLMVLLKLQLAAFDGDPATIRRALAEIGPYRGSLPAIVGSSGWPVLVFYKALAEAAAAEDDRSAARKLDRGARQLRALAAEGATDHAHRALLLEAERLRHLGRPEATGRFEAAMAQAAASGHVHEEALAAEHAARYHEAEGRVSSAMGCWLKARDAYTRWGATAKVRRLEAERPALAGLGPQAATASSGPRNHGTALDYLAVMRAAQTISGEIRPEALFQTLLSTILATAGASRGVLMLMTDHGPEAAAEAESSGRFALLAPTPMDDGMLVPPSVITYATRSRETVVLDSREAGERRFPADPYLQRHAPPSAMAAPLLRQGQMVGVLYLENRLISGAFADDRLEATRLLAAQVAVSLENARLYRDLAELNRTLESQVAERTRELSDQTQLLEMTMASMSDGIAVFDRDHRLLSCNAQARRIFGLPEDSNWYGCIYGDIVDELAARSTFVANQRPSFEGGTVDELEFADGRVIRIRRNPMPDGGMVRVYQDVTADRRMEAELRRLATIDSLTGVANRRRFFELAEQEISRARRHDRPLAAIMIDVDHFKSVNDTHGHAIGDRLLVEVAQRCRASLRDGDWLGRLGGEEFAIILAEPGSPADALAVAERIRAALADAAIPSDCGGTVHATASLGVAMLGESESIDSLLARADAALYWSKKNGRNRVTFAEG